MNWDAIGAIGEILGAIAVFASLIYLALQIKQNTLSLKAAAKHAATSRQLDPDDRDVFGQLMYKAFFTFSEAYYECRHAHFDVSQWLESSEAIDWHLSHPGARDWWRHPRRRAFPNDFKDLVEERLQEIAKRENIVDA